jgi:hypothetical protein
MKPKCSWKSFCSTLHMTLECRDTKLWPISRCITMSLLWRGESIKSNTRIKLVCWRITHSRHSSTYCSLIDQWSLRVLLDCTMFLTRDVAWISKTKKLIAWRSWSLNAFIPFVCRVLTLPFLQLQSSPKNQPIYRRTWVGRRSCSLLEEMFQGISITDMVCSCTTCATKA